MIADQPRLATADPVFRTDEIKEIACKAPAEARESGKFALYAYVIMPDHLHAITDSARSSADTLRFIDGIMGHRVIAYLKERGYESSLQKLRQEAATRECIGCLLPVDRVSANGRTG